MWGQGALQCHGEACVCARRWPAVHACHSTGSGQLRDTVLKEFQVSNIYHASVEVSFIVFQFSMFFVSLYCQIIMLFSVLCSGNSPALSVYPQLDREVMSWPGRCASELHELGHVFQSLCSSSWAPFEGLWSRQLLAASRVLKVRVLLLFIDVWASVIEVSRLRDELFRLTDEQTLGGGLCTHQDESEILIFRPKRNVGSRVLHWCDFCT